MAGISVGIIVREKLAGIETTLASLAANNQPLFDVVLLGDGIQAEHMARFAAYAQSNTATRRGTAACFNRLIQRDSGNYYLLLEAGAQVGPGWLDHLLAGFQRYPKCGVAGPSTNRAPNAQCVFPHAMDQAQEVARTAEACSRRFGKTCRSPEPVHSLSDFCYLVKREVAEQIGYADEGYGTGSLWAADYNLRAARAGFPALWACAAYVHRAPEEERELLDEQRYLLALQAIARGKFCGLEQQNLKHRSSISFPGQTLKRSGNTSVITETRQPTNRPADSETFARTASESSATIYSSKAPASYRELSEYRNAHEGSTMLVCGCGASLNTLPHPRSFLTIGVNDVGRMFQPDYLVVVNPRDQFHNDRFRFVEESQARCVFTQLELGLSNKAVVRFKLGKRGGADFSDPNVLNYTSNSPYIALCLAVHMGARRIGIIGVDFTQHHFFGQTGTHPLERQLPHIDREYQQLYAECRRRNVEVVNLSQQSRLTAFPKMSWEEFAAGEEKSLNIVSYATSPVAGVPAMLARCITARTAHRCRTVWARNSYGNGVCFEGDVEWEQAPEEAVALLEAADVVIVHNGKLHPRHSPVLAAKPLVTMAHNYMWNVDPSFVRQGFPGIVVGQYQAALPEFRDWHAVPNPVPLWEPAFSPAEKSSQITICYTPSAKHESYPAQHPLYWHSKGYDTTMRTLDRLAQRFPVQLEVIRGRQVSHTESLAMKKRSHIVIDECVTGSYHRNSLEGLALGCVVVNGLGLVPSIAETLRRCTHSDAEFPFVTARLQDLEQVLASLIEEGAEVLASRGMRNREWMERNWHFGKQWNRYWRPVVLNAIETQNSSERTARLATERRQTAVEPVKQTHGLAAVTPGVSVVVCHGGPERLHQLSAALANLRQCEGVDEIIVSEMGTDPVAEDVARRWADKYIFLRNESIFERARCLNAGTALAEYDLVFWSDNDLVYPRGFIRKAAEEMRAAAVDYLIPYSRIGCLSEVDSGMVIQGVRNPCDCAPMDNVVPLRAAYGAAGIMKLAFFLAHGGIPEQFRGWGGEDDAWWHKAGVLGRTAVTRLPEQHITHLFHANSGSYLQQSASNPYYDHNLAALKEISSVRDRETFLARYPRQQPFRDWNTKRIEIVSADNDTDSMGGLIAQALSRLAQLPVCCRSVSEGLPDTENAESPAAYVFCDFDAALTFLSDEAKQPGWRKTVVLYSGGDPGPENTSLLQRAAAVVGLSASHATNLNRLGICAFPRRQPLSSASSPLQVAITLIQPLSIILGGFLPAKSSRQTCVAEQRRPSSSVENTERDLPVWMYWEGSCPEWIRRCQETVFRHSKNVRLLSREEFEKLREDAHNIELDRLHAAQRADYVRAFLLAKYGGVWIDSDCIVMRSLQPLLHLLGDFDFVAHRERATGFWSNDVMVAPTRSKVAAALYRDICNSLRSDAPVGWTELGCLAVTRAVNSTQAPCFEIQSERVQPICWNHPDPFVRLAPWSEHEAALDRSALCYMLSNLTMQKKFGISDVSEPLLRDGTLFRFLLRKSLEGESGSKECEPLDARAPGVLGTPHPGQEVFQQLMISTPPQHNASRSGPGSSLPSTDEIRQRLPFLIEDLGINSILDAGCGDFHWLQQLRLELDQYVGTDVVPSLIAENQRDFAGPNRRFLALDITWHDLPAADLVLCRDTLVLLSYQDIFRALANFKRSGSRYLLTTTFPGHSENRDASTGAWRPLNLQLPPFSFPEPLRTINEKCIEGEGRYSDKSLGLWRIEELPASLPSDIRITEAPPFLHISVPKDNSESHTDVGAGCELAVIVPAYVGNGQQARLRNLTACLRALNSQNLDRSQYRLVVVEQDREPRLKAIAQELADRYIFLHNSGAFNKGWALNVGVQAATHASTLCLIDADILPGPAFLSSVMERMGRGCLALRPFEEVIYLDNPSTERAIQDSSARAVTQLAESRYSGQSFRTSKGGCLFVERRLYLRVCGFDERFRGFGFEDTEFFERLSRHSPVEVLPGKLLHLHHPPTVDRHCSASNGNLYGQLAKGSVPAWTGPMGNPHRYLHEHPDLGASHDSMRPAGTDNGNHANVSFADAFLQMARYCSRSGQESVSGPGSSLLATVEIRKALPLIVRDLNVRSLLDAACGDFNWMRYVELSLDRYFGVDLLPILLEQNCSMFGGQNRTFLNLDITRDKLPQADLVLCRDCLVHHSFEDIFKTLNNFKESGSEYLLLTTFSSRDVNTDIRTGGWRPLNFLKSPFNFPPPLLLIDEKCVEGAGEYADKSLALWQLRSVTLEPQFS
ncbi:MAG TPA: glycosyltransferase [Candidatus Bathyarchaeia archaeon]|nr:glycosyltransferase [Candidatus Bathyarchaeia archaeon]